MAGGATGQGSVVTAIGLMSGTSLDGIDAAVIETDGENRVTAGAFLTIPYEDGFRAALRGCLGGKATAARVAEVERQLTDAHAEAVRRLLAQAGLTPSQVAVIGFHGHTLLHAPERRLTWQIGDGGRLAALCDIAVVNDFRGADVAAGGQGAPFVPLYHQALASRLARPLAVLNLGGVGNLTWLGSGGAVLAGDTGPGNALIDDWVLAHTGQRYDEGGRLAAAGRVDAAVLDTLLAAAYFARPLPKSLDRDAFDPAPAAGLGLADGAATLTAFTAASVAAALPLLPEPPQRWLVTGGGRHNATLMAMLAERLGVQVDPVEAVGWSGDALEGQAFAWLAVRSRRGLPLSLPGTTGVPEPTRGGRWYPPPDK
ncbi:MAG: anhydro-N-acetylmuramic acid kinase [Azospirillum sp.]|nr:anhydro-N-acetylmuramic acid kinase [Azospirillum sp.]